jgi:hypothetical protein
METAIVSTMPVAFFGATTARARDDDDGARGTGRLASTGAGAPGSAAGAAAVASGAFVVLRAGQ